MLARQPSYSPPISPPRPEPRAPVGLFSISAQSKNLFLEQPAPEPEPEPDARLCRLASATECLQGLPPAASEGPAPSTVIRGRVTSAPFAAPDEPLPLLAPGRLTRLARQKSSCKRSCPVAAAARACSAAATKVAASTKKLGCDHFCEAFKLFEASKINAEGGPRVLHDVGAAVRNPKLAATG